MLKKLAVVIMIVIMVWLAMPAFSQTSQPVSWFSWGEPHNETVIEMIPADDHFADIVVTNRITPSYLSNPIEIDLVLDGVVVRVIFTGHSYDIPDQVEAIPQPGYYAIPNTVTAPDDEITIIEIHQMMLG